MRCLLTLWLCVVATPAWAHGKVPGTLEVAPHPTSASHWTVRATYGLLQTHDAGTSWQWVCEQVLGNGVLDLTSWLGGDRWLVGTTAGIRSTTDGGCTWSSAKLPLPMLEVSGLRSDSGGRLVALVRDPGEVTGRLVVSTDQGQSWSWLGQPFPPGVAGLWLHGAPDQPQRWFVSGLAGSGAVVVRTDDDGQSWVTLPLPATQAEQVLAVGPKHKDGQGGVVVLRQSAGDLDRLLSSDDGGQTWQQRATVQGAFLAAALAPDGAQLAVSVQDMSGQPTGVTSGLRVYGLPGWQAQTWATAAPRCLSWTSVGLLACGHEANDGYALALCSSAGCQARLHTAQLVPKSCPAGSNAAQVCAEPWLIVQSRLNLDAGRTTADDAGATDAGHTDSATSGQADASAQDADAASVSPTGAAEVSPASRNGNGGCRAQPRGVSGAWQLLWPAWFVWRRRQAQPKCSMPAHTSGIGG